MDTGQHRGQFAPTRWSVAPAAADQIATAAAEALTSLCQSYWFPLYSYARRQGYSPHDAEDLTGQVLTGINA